MNPRPRTLSEAEAWAKYDAIESRLTANVSERMLDLAGLRPGMRLIDLASGRGEPSLRAAQRVGPEGFVLGVDISEPLLAMARVKARDEGIANIELRAGDAESLDGVANASFDGATARWGLMSVRALASTHRVLKPGAVLVAAFWAEVERAPWAFLPRQVLGRYRDVPRTDGDVPGAFRYADPSRIARDFTEAGFAVEHIEEIDVAVIEAETGNGIVEWVRELGLARLASELPESEEAAWATELAGEVEQYRAGAMIRLGGVTRLVVGRRNG